MAYTGYSPVLNPVFLARDCMLSRVGAKQAKTTKVKDKFVNGKKKVQKNTQLSFWWKAKSSI